MGKLLVIVLAPFRFPVLQVFPGFPDNPAVIYALVMLKRVVLPSPKFISFQNIGRGWERGMLFVYGEMHICGDEVSKMSTSAPDSIRHIYTI